MEYERRKEKMITRFFESQLIRLPNKRVCVGVFREGEEKWDYRNKGKQMISTHDNVINKVIAYFILEPREQKISV